MIKCFYFFLLLLFSCLPTSRLDDKELFFIFIFFLVASQPQGGMIKYFYGLSRHCRRHHFTHHQHTTFYIYILHLQARPTHCNSAARPNHQHNAIVQKCKSNLPASKRCLIHTYTVHCTPKPLHIEYSKSQVQ